MILKNDFSVAAPVDDTWRTLLDVERVAGCLPGATIEPAGEDGIYRGTLGMKLGPMRMSYGGTVQLKDVDDDAHTMSFDAAARESGGTGSASAVIRVRIQEDGQASQVDVETDLNVTGRAAQFGRGIMDDVATKMLDRFADGLRDLIAAGASSNRPIPGDEVDRARGRDATGAQPAAQAATERPGRASAPTDDDALDLGAGILSLISPQRATAAGTAVLAAGFLALARRRGRRSRIELTFTLRLR